MAGRRAEPPDRSAEETRWSTWMAEAQDGNSASYRKLLEELDQVLRAYLQHLMGDRELVDDCLQECLLAIHRARHTYDPKRPFRPWMLALARHKTVDALRRRSTRSRREGPDADSAADRGHQPGDAAEAAMDAQRILDRVDPRFREALTLTKLEGHSIEEAAQLAGVSRTAMKSRVHRGLRQLQKQLAVDWI